jgi:Pro-kumamolisin, activation domain/Viral BACON domain
LDRHAEKLERKPAGEKRKAHGKLTWKPDAINYSIVIVAWNIKCFSNPGEINFLSMSPKTFIFRCFGLALFLSWAANCPVFGGDLKILRDHVPAIVAKLTPLGDLPATNELRLAIGLPLRDAPGLSHFLADVYNPASPNFRKFLTPAEFTARFGPTEKDYAAVENFARANGFKITGTHGNRLLLDVQAKTADIQRAFHINLKRFKHPNETRDFFAAVNEPTVDLSLPVADVSGLNNYQRPYPKLIKKNSALKAALAKTGSAPTGDYLGDDFRAAYVPNTTLTGAGQTVGLLQFDGFYAGDISKYANLAGGGRANIPVETVLLDGYNGVPTTGTQSGNSEVALDIEMAMAMAPGLDQIIVFSGGPNGSQNDILNAMAASNTVKNLSCSWGWSGGPSTTTDNIFQEMAAQGQSFFNASGDSDAFTSTSVNAVDNSRLPNAPSSSPYITQVGGTTLTTAGAGGPWSSETVWNWGGDQGSSGGISSYYLIPDWQTGVSMASNQGSTTHRNIPDVALTADNVFVYSSDGQTGSFGGTSCAAPLWAGFLALVNQQAAAVGKPPVGFINPVIYAIASGINYTQDLHDITTGNNFRSKSLRQFSATKGYDLCTGLGTPAGTNLINALTGFGDFLQLHPNGDMTVSAVGGAFPPLSASITLSNSGGFDLNWQSVSNPTPWLTLSPTAGTLAPGTTTSVVLNFTAAVNTLALGFHPADLLFYNTTAGTVKSVPFSLQALPPLSVQPTAGVVFTGPVGGPFLPAAQTFTIGNLGTTNYAWKAAESLSWLALNQSTGVVLATSSAQFTATISTNANKLKAAVYKGYVTVTSSNKKLNVKIPLTLNIGQSIAANGGFETGDFTGWTLNADASFTRVGNTKGFVHSGKYGALLGQADSIGYLSQTVPTTAGRNYLISIWLTNPKNANAATPNEFQVQWEGNTLLDQVDIPFTGWTNLQFTVTATNSGSLLQLGFRDKPWFLGLDDVSVTPAPTPHVLAATVLNPAAFHFTFSATAGATYQVQCATNLAAPVWQNLGGPVVAGGDTLTLSDTNTANFPQKFYRLQLINPAP